MWLIGPALNSGFRGKKRLGVFKSHDSKETVAIVSMDLSKAFDSIPHALLLAKLKAYGLGEMSIGLLRSYLFARIQHVKIGDTIF